MKHKEGDVVVVKSDLSLTGDYGPYCATGNMVELAGKKVIIKSVKAVGFGVIILLMNRKQNYVGQMKCSKIQQ